MLFSLEDGDAAVEIFEWDLTRYQAERMHKILVKGTNRRHPAGRFRSASTGFFCCMSVSDFLMRFAGDIMTVPDTYFYPHNLEKVLYEQSPKRVLIFRRNGDLDAYVKPPEEIDKNKKR